MNACDPSAFSSIITYEQWTPASNASVYPERVKQEIFVPGTTQLATMREITVLGFTPSVDAGLFKDPLLPGGTRVAENPGSEAHALPEAGYAVP